MTDIAPRGSEPATLDAYFALNRASWDERADVHAASPGYAIEQLRADPERLSDVVAFDRPRLGDLRGVRGVHLQCHIGTDTASLARLGARMSGLDFSASSIAQARSLAERLGLEIDFHEANAHDAVAVLGAEAYDLVYTGVGALCWLPSIERWAATVAGLLRPGGRLFVREGHPILWTMEHEGDPGRRPDLGDTLVVRYPYFERPEPTQYDEPGTYVETDHVFEHTRSAEWNHGIGEIVTALLGAGMELTMLIEHDTVPWEGLPGLMVMDADHDEWRLRDGRERLPLSYTLQAVKRG